MEIREISFLEHCQFLYMRYFDEHGLNFQITECAKTLQFKLSSGTSFDGGDRVGDIEGLEHLTEWRNAQAPKHASSVLDVLLRTGDYETAKLWCSYVSFPEQKFLVKKIIFYFELIVL